MFHFLFHTYTWENSWRVGSKKALEKFSFLAGAVSVCNLNSI